MNPAGDLRGRALWMVIACLICHMGLGYTYTLGGLQADVTSELSIGRASFASAAMMRNYVMALVSPLVGLLAVRWGARPVLVVSILLLGVSAQGLGGITSAPQLLGWSLVLGFAMTGLGDVTVGHAVSQWVQHARGLALGIVYTASNLGASILLRILPVVTEERSWREAFAFTGWGATLLLLPFALLVRGPRKGEGAADAAVESDQATSDAADLDVRQALRTRSFWVLGFAMTTYFAYAVAVIEHFVAYLIDQGVPRGVASVYWSNAVAMGIAGKLVFGFVSDRISPRYGLAVLLALISVSSFVLLRAPDAPYLWLFLLSFGFSYAARDVLCPLIVIECFGARYMARIYGVLMLSLLIGGGPGSVLAGASSDVLDSYRPAFGLLSLLNVVALLGVALLRSERAARAT